MAGGTFDVRPDSALYKKKSFFGSPLDGLLHALFQGAWGRFVWKSVKYCYYHYILAYVSVSQGVRILYDDNKNDYWFRERMRRFTPIAVISIAYTLKQKK